MFDIGWSELILIGVIALIVVGPKDLPEMFRTLGRFTAKARSMARDFSRAMEDVAKEAGVDDVARDLRKATSPSALGLDAVKNAATKFESWDPMKTVKNMGPATQALADQQAAKKAAASATVAPPVAEALKPVPAAKPVAKAAPRPRPEPIRRRKIDAAAPARRAVPRKPLSKKPDA